MKAFVIFRDRVSYAMTCIERLEDAGLEVIIVNKETSYPPALEWLGETPLPVYSVANSHPQDLWKEHWFINVVDPAARYIVTDCDVAVDRDCPEDWVDHLSAILEQHPDRCKVGLGLRTDNLPAHYRHRTQVQEWEKQHWANKVSEGLYGAAVDTTLAMYQPLRAHPKFSLGPAPRTGSPYLARHLSWYEDSSWDEEERSWYEEHMNRDYSHWIAPERYS